jgi:hypothetical protein
MIWIVPSSSGSMPIDRGDSNNHQSGMSNFLIFRLGRKIQDPIKTPRKICMETHIRIGMVGMELT